MAILWQSSHKFPVLASYRYHADSVSSDCLSRDFAVAGPEFLDVAQFVDILKDISNDYEFILQQYLLNKTPRNHESHKFTVIYNYTFSDDTFNHLKNRNIDAVVIFIKPVNLSYVEDFVCSKSYEQFKNNNKLVVINEQNTVDEAFKEIGRSIAYTSNSVFQESMDQSSNALMHHEIDRNVTNFCNHLFEKLHCYPTSCINDYPTGQNEVNIDSFQAANHNFVLIPGNIGLFEWEACHFLQVQYNHYIQHVSIEDGLNFILRHENKYKPFLIHALEKTDSKIPGDLQLAGLFYLLQSRMDKTSTRITFLISGIRSDYVMHKITSLFENRFVAIRFLFDNEFHIVTKLLKTLCASTNVFISEKDSLVLFKQMRSSTSDWLSRYSYSYQIVYWHYPMLFTDYPFW
ncbi:hypothetical protein GJ496_004030 [Pomphorhynchus laevis]|nr:hypothetical protein GJ496_004030 [Pomphorhynchus laevis]